MTLTIPASDYGSVHCLYAGGVLMNRIRDWERIHGPAVWWVMEDGSVRVEKK